MPEREVPDGLIPHRGPARLVQTILEDPRPDVLVCGGRIPADSAFAAGLRDEVSAFYISGATLLAANMARVMTFVTASRKPSVGPYPDWARAGF